MLQVLSISILTLVTQMVLANENPKVDFKIDLNETQATKELLFKPLPGHHFNLKAPSLVKKTSGTQDESLSLELDPSQGRVSLGKLDSNCTIKTELYICDDQNTYCIPKAKAFSCADLLQNRVAALSEETSITPARTQGQTHDGVFIINDPRQAFELAQKTHKALLIDFFGTWCPPCNILDETVFNSQEFKKLKKDFVYLKLDADDSVSWELKAKYDIKGYPTVIFSNPQGEEISRVVGSRSLKAFLKEMTLAAKDKNLSFEDRKKRAESMKSPEQTWAFGEMHWRQDEFAKALKYFSMAAKKKTLNEREKDLLQFIPLILISRSTDKDLQKKSVELLKVSLQSYPLQETFYDKLASIGKIAEDQKDEDLKKWTQEQTIALADLWLKEPKRLKDMEMTVADLWSLKATAFEELKRDQEAKEAYKKTAEAYTQMIKSQKLNLESSRGYNIERIYAIYKSGDLNLADQLYQQMQKIYPNEFTFFYNHAQALKELKKNKEAMEKAEKAYQYSYGDNKLRAVYLLAELMAEKGEKKKAVQFIDETVASTTLPKEENVRTHRYMARLKKLKESL